MKKISLLLPTRERLPLLKRFLQSVEDTAQNLDNLEVVMYLDDDDITSGTITHDRIPIKKVIGPRVSMGAANSHCLANAEGDIIILANDDMVIGTRGWDAKIRELDKSLDDGVYLAYANDLYMGKALPTFPILSRKTCETLVSPFPKEYRGGFIDYHLMDIFKRLQKLGMDRIFYFRDIHFEHLHHRSGKAEMDKTYQRRGPIDTGDETFIALRRFRQISAMRLFATDGATLPILPKPITPPKWSSSFVRCAYNCLAPIAFDMGIPFLWKLDLLALFTARCLAKKGIRLGKGYRRKISSIMDRKTLP